MPAKGSPLKTTTADAQRNNACHLSGLCHRPLCHCIALAAAAIRTSAGWEREPGALECVPNPLSPIVSSQPGSKPLRFTDPGGGENDIATDYVRMCLCKIMWVWRCRVLSHCNGETDLPLLDLTGDEKGTFVLLSLFLFGHFLSSLDATHIRTMEHQLEAYTLQSLFF